MSGLDLLPKPDPDLSDFPYGKPRKIKIYWSCSDYCHHQHKHKWTAFLCGRIQYLFNIIKSINL